MAIHVYTNPDLWGTDTLVWDDITQLAYWHETGIPNIADSPPWKVSRNEIDTHLKRGAYKLDMRMLVPPGL